MQVFSTVSNCRKCVAFCLKDVEICEESIKERVPDQPRLEESSENVGKVKHSLSGNEKEEVKKGEVPAEGQYTTEKKLKNRGTLKNLKGNEQKSVKKSRSKEDERCVHVLLFLLVS